MDTSNKSIFWIGCQHITPHTIETPIHNAKLIRMWILLYKLLSNQTCCWPAKRQCGELTLRATKGISGVDRRFKWTFNCTAVHSMATVANINKHFFTVRVWGFSSTRFGILDTKRTWNESQKLSKCLPNYEINIQVVFGRLMIWLQSWRLHHTTNHKPLKSLTINPVFWCWSSVQQHLVYIHHGLWALLAGREYTYTETWSFSTEQDALSTEWLAYLHQSIR